MTEQFKIFSIRMYSADVKALDTVIEALQKLDYRIGNKKMTRNAFIVNAIKSSASQALKIIEKEIKT